MKKTSLDGYYEEGYHYYMEIRGRSLTVRDYARRIELETKFKTETETGENGERIVLKLNDPVLSRDGYGKPFTWIKKLAFENGRLEMDYYYTIMGDTHYTLEKVDHGPFAHIKIRDHEWISLLQGEWVNALRPESTLVFKKNTLAYCYKGSPLFRNTFHVISYVTSPNEVRIVNEDLTSESFDGLQEIKIEPDMLTTREIIMDASTPLLAFVRRNKVGSVSLPPAAYEPIRNTMLPPRTDDVPMERIKPERAKEEQ